MADVRQALTAPGAPPAVGPYSHAVLARACADANGGLLFCSGQIPLDPETGELVDGTPAVQARRCLENLQAVCRAAGTALARAVRVTVYMTDLAAFAEVNEVYASFFDDEPPARVTIGVAQLPMGAYVEIDATVSL
jgi:2-iminobutanoate/2-iminopropanoate deaminase